MIACLGVVHLASAQKAAIKTNLLYDATTTFNLGAEFALSRSGHWMCRGITILGHSQTTRNGNIGSYSRRQDIGSATR